MANYVGIDLGTTNSVICSYDAPQTRIWKSPERNDVTPSAIYFGRRGNKLIGQKAYNQFPHAPENCAILFKRKIGTSELIELPAVNRTLTPMECSAEILKTLFGYLPEEIRNSEDTGTVVTVPAVFDQMKKNATMEAAETAGIGKVALMQEPVAAVMSFMRERDTDGMFLIYDIGGGTFDVAIAQSTAGSVNLLAHGGIQVCGGRDFDRLIAHNIVLPTLHEKYALSDDLSNQILRVAERTSEDAKIDLSSMEQSTIVVSEFQEDEPLLDLNGCEIYQEIPLDRDTFDKLIAEKIDDTINCARKTMSECGVNPQDLDCIVWIGGPTNYKPLRDKVSLELNIKGDLSMDPMTAVAEGASLFAESIDWSSESRSRKPIRGQISPNELALSFNYTARTPRDTSKIVVQTKGQVPVGTEFQVECLDTGWTSGQIPLKHGATIDVSLTKPGENTFKVVVCDAVGEPISIEQNEIIITKTAATVDAIPASHSIALEALDKPSGRRIPVHLIKKSESLPKKGSIELTAGETLIAGSSHSLKFLLWEGEIEDPIDNNRFVGCFEITGSDFDEGVIPDGADLRCNYEILDAEVIKLEVEVPDIGGIFESSHQDFYSRKEGEDSSLDAARIANEANQARSRIDQIEKKVDDPRLKDARRKLEAANTLDPEESDSEKIQEASQGGYDANTLIDEVRKENLKEIRQIDLDETVAFFDKYIRQHARPAEATAFDNLVATAQRSIDNNDPDTELGTHLRELGGRSFEILWRQPWFVVDTFRDLVSNRDLYMDKPRFDELVEQGMQLIASEDIQRLENLTQQERMELSFIRRSDVIEELRDVIRSMMSLPRIGGSEQNQGDLVANVLIKHDS